jgi:hypothetical protein
MEEIAARVAEVVTILKKTEVSASAMSDLTNATRLVDGESITATALSLFGDENGLGFPLDANADFFSKIRISQSLQLCHTTQVLSSNATMPSMCA